MEYPRPLTLGVLVNEWFDTENLHPYIYSMAHRFNDVHHINCTCHVSSRALAVIIDDDLIARVFPYEYINEKVQKDWMITLEASDPEFFKKLREGLDDAHRRRYAAKIK